MRSVPLSPLLLELSEVQFTGILTLTWGTSTSTLVFENGKVLLAEYPPRAGDGAWETITRLGDQAVGAILSDLDAMQMKLVAEFNPPCLLSTPSAPARGAGGPKRVAVLAQTEAAQRKEEPGPVMVAVPETRRPDAEPVMQPPRATAWRDTERGRKPPAFPIPPKVPPGRAGSPGPQSAPPAAPPVHLPPGKVTARQKGEHPEGGTLREGEPIHGALDPVTLANLEMAALDEMDVDHIATKIRKNARGIVKKLHLGHLMTEKDE